MADFKVGTVPNFECTLSFGGDVDLDVEAQSLERAERRSRNTIRRRIRNGSLKSGHLEPLQVECEPK